MAMRKATIQQQVAQSIHQQNPTDRPIVTIMGLSGPSPLIMGMITTLWMLFVKAYFITVTEQAVLIQRASKWTARPHEILHAIPRDQAPYLLTDVQPRTLWSFIRFQIPGEQKPSRINVNRAWKREMEQLAQVIHSSAPQGQPVPGQQPYGAPQFPQQQGAPQGFPQQPGPAPQGFPQQGGPQMPQQQPH
ncbi:MAG: hypothetical protein HOV68_14245, partial [Streptomycetaceae bacterium]|nr:hypothetical protein [Streptomycetaceae bacterium]